MSDLGWRLLCSQIFLELRVGDRKSLRPIMKKIWIVPWVILREIAMSTCCLVEDEEMDPDSRLYMVLGPSFPAAHHA